MKNQDLVQQSTAKSRKLWQYVSLVVNNFNGDATPDEVHGAIEGHHEQIRHMPAEAQESILMAEVLSLAKQYGAREELDAGTMNEAVDFIIQSFPWLGVREIRIAFRWHASGKTKTKAGEMYGGMFTIRALGAILSEYNEVRKRIVAEYVDLKAKEVQMRINAQKEEHAKVIFQKKLLEDLDRARAEKIEWKDVPAWWHDSLHSRGILCYTDKEKAAAWEDSRLLEKGDSAAEKRRANPFQSVALNNRDPQARRIAIAKKLLVWRKLIGKKQTS